MDPEKLDFEASAAMFFNEAYMWKQVIFAFSNYRNSKVLRKIDNIILI